MFNRWDICQAYYAFAILWHRGQGSKEYRIFGRLDQIGFRPGLMFDETDLTDNARAVYDRLVERHKAKE